MKLVLARRGVVFAMYHINGNYCATLYPKINKLIITQRKEGQWKVIKTIKGFLTESQSHKDLTNKAMKEVDKIIGENNGKIPENRETVQTQIFIKRKIKR